MQYDKAKWIEVNSVVELLKQTSSVKLKIEILKEHKDNELLAKILLYCSI